ncbi:zinc finger BED domain-containing protein 4-like [Hyperolius riggenbachi]|uniref:zinc finger BED domain-containing protein 4-like n=1 Tax=Hyperolius riggenbachi TaxID=752182 RepID=UPI0035A289F3
MHRLQSLQGTDHPTRGSPAANMMDGVFAAFVPHASDVKLEEGAEEPIQERAGQFTHMAASGWATSVYGSQQPQPYAETITHHLTRVRATLPSSRKGLFTAPVWQFFCQSAKDECVAICTLCHAQVRRGKVASKLGTGGLHSHLKNHHRWEFEKCKQSVESSTTAVPASAEASYHLAHAPGTRKRSQPSSVPSTVALKMEADDTSQSSGASSAPSTASCSVQRRTLIQDTFPATEALPQSDRHIRKLNGMLARAMSSQLLPYSLVEKGTDMHELLQYGIPEWCIPSRHYFSKMAIPALHEFAVQNVTHALDHSVGDRVHLTMDSWSSRYGQERYLSFTCHWVTIVEGGEASAATGVAAAQLVVPPRGVRGNRAAVLYDPDPSANAGSPHKHAHLSSSVEHRHCQALLQLVTLGTERPMAENVLAALREQEQRWLTPRGLRIGQVICDNSANLLDALRAGDLSHVPCLAQVLNLVVQRFLRTYPGMDDVLKRARTVVAHFHCSPIATALLSDLQQQQGLQPHRLVADCPTRWNSTLAMLERLCQHRSAVSRYLLEQNITGVTTLSVVTSGEWEQMQQVCLVLAPFQQGINLLSQEKASICAWLPMIFLLDRALSDLLDQGAEALEELDQQTVQTPSEEEMQVVEDRLEVPDLAAEGEHESAASLVRGWGDLESQRQSEDECVFSSLEDVQRAHLFPMAAHMLQCLRGDPWVVEMKAREDLWVALILDPRIKGKLGEFVPCIQQEVRTRELQEALIRRLEEAFPQPSTPHDPVQQVPTAHSTRRPGDLLGLTRALYKPEQSRGGLPAASSTQRRMTRMVAEYMGSLSAYDSMSMEDPMEYWVKRLDTWRELAQYALEVLSCPPSSVLSERCFSAAGGVVTEKRSSLSIESVERLTFMKINQAWVEGDFLAPTVEEQAWAHE